MRYQSFIFTLFLSLFLLSEIFSETKAQNIETSVDLIGVFSTSDMTPFWIQSNRQGRFSRHGSQVLNRVQAHGHTHLFDNSRISVNYGTDLISRPGPEGTVTFNQGYVKLNAYGVELAGGRFHSYTPISDHKLGMGSLGVSGNAVPVPQVRFGLPDWTSLPFTRDFIQIRAHVAHGWLGSRRYTENVLYHEKVGHARFGGDFPLNLYGGIAHYAKWGGENNREFGDLPATFTDFPLNLYGGIAHYAKWGGENNREFGDLPATFTDFWRVFFALGGDDDAPDVEADYMLGDHLGAWDFGFYLEFDSFSINGYRQHPLETKDNLKLKSLQDALNGISFRFDERVGLPIRGFVYEYMYTKWQDGPRVENVLDDGTRCFEFPERCRDMFQGNENYYNHHIYRTGWATQGRTIGNPLFRTVNTPLDQLVDGIDNNRIIAHHIGVETHVGRSSIIGKFTASRNFGTRNDPFPEPADQLSMGLQSQTPVSLFDQPFILLADVALDNGDLYGSQFGFALGLRWTNSRN